MELFFQMEQVPVFCNVLCESREQALAFPRADIRLGWCVACDLIYNIAFDATRLNYSAAYENSLHFSPHFQRFAEVLADELIERYELQNKNIIEIGCGQGDFLRLLAERGSNRAFGFDPSYRLGQSTTPVSAGSVTLVPEAFSGKHMSRQAELICCRHVLEHIEHPAEFLEELRNTLGDRTETNMYFEVPDAFYTLKDMGIWDIIYEHCAYYTPRALGLLFTRCGFDVLRLDERYDNQFLSVEARPTAGTQAGLRDCIPTDSARSYVDAFAQEYERKKEHWQTLLNDWQKRSQCVVLWGAGSKGVTFLNALEITAEQLPWIVDINPRKQGRYVVGTGQQIIAPAELSSVRPDVVVIMNPTYQREIENTLSENGLSARVQAA